MVGHGPLAELLLLLTLLWLSLHCCVSTTPTPDTIECRMKSVEAATEVKMPFNITKKTFLITFKLQLPTENWNLSIHVTNRQNEKDTIILEGSTRVIRILHINNCSHRHPWTDAVISDDTIMMRVTLKETRLTVGVWSKLIEWEEFLCRTNHLVHQTSNVKFEFCSDNIGMKIYPCNNSDTPLPGTDEVPTENCYPCLICYIILSLALATVFLMALWQAIKLWGRSTYLRCCQGPPPPHSPHATQLRKKAMQCPQTNTNHVSSTTTLHQAHINKQLRLDRPLQRSSRLPAWDLPQRPWAGHEERHPSLECNSPPTNTFHDSFNSIYGAL
nr:uncharacterized protein LOC123760226 [Procambarus clarkii]